MQYTLMEKSLKTWEWDESWPFPDPRDYIDDTDNPVWVLGGELDEDTIWWAYHCGFFPWFDFRKKVVQWCGPTVRFVIKPEEIHVSHSMRNLINRDLYRVTFDTAFSEVMDKCAVGSHHESNRFEMPGAWLGDTIKRIYKGIFDSDGIGPDHMHAHSVEVRDRVTDEIVGGLYGLVIGHVFVGESMFSLRPDTSKLALIELARRLGRDKGHWLIDCQMPTPHLKSMGAGPMPFDEYLDYLWS